MLGGPSLLHLKNQGWPGSFPQSRPHHHSLHTLPSQFGPKLSCGCFMHMISMEIYGDACFLYSTRGSTHARTQRHTLHTIAAVSLCQLHIHLYRDSRHTATRLQRGRAPLSIFTETEMVTQPVFSFLHSANTGRPRAQPHSPGTGQRGMIQTRACLQVRGAHLRGGHMHREESHLLGCCEGVSARYYDSSEE